MPKPWTDYEFEQAFLGRRQANVLHRYEVSPDRWHVCYVDSNDIYHHGYWRFAEGCFEPERPEPCPVCTDPGCRTCCRQSHLEPAVAVTGGYPHHIPGSVYESGSD